MSYTLEQKIEARAKGELWWRFPIPKLEENKQWSRPNILHITSPVAIYFIGPTPPRVLSELEGELLAELKLIAETDPVDAALDPQRAGRIARAAIAKATP